MEKSITKEFLLQHGFDEKLDGAEFVLKQYGGYHDFVYYDFKRNRIVIQYKLQSAELLECDIKNANSILKLLGLPNIDKLRLSA